MFCRLTVSVLVVVNLCGLLFAQHAVDPVNRYYRIIALVHLHGIGKGSDPLVPEYVAEGVAAAAAGNEAAVARAASIKAAGDNPAGGPAPTKAFLVTRPGIVAWGMQPADDGQMAIIQLVAVDHHAFDAILSDKRPDVRVFEIGKDSREAIEKEMQKFKRDFSLEGFRVLAQ